MSRVWRVSLGVTFFLFLVYVASKYLVPEFMALLYKVLLVLIPFIISIVIALFLEPLVRLMVQRFKMSRTVAAGLTMLLVLGTVLAVFFLLIFRLGVELVELSVSLPQYTQSMQEFLANIVEQGKLYYFKYPDVVKQINENFGSIAKQLSDFISAMAQSLLHLATGVPGVVLGSIVALIATYFFIKDRHLIVAFWLRVVPEPWGRYVLTICNEAVGALFNYIRAQAVLVTLTMLQAIIGLHIIGIPYAVTVGILVGVEMCIRDRPRCIPI